MQFATLVTKHRSSRSSKLFLYLLTAVLFNQHTPVCAQKKKADAAPQKAYILPPRLSALDSANGFRHYVFGSQFNQWPPPLPTIHSRRGQLTGEILAETVMIGDLLLQGIWFSFYNGRLSRIDFAPTSQTYTAELLRVLESIYGPGQPSGVHQVSWQGKVITLVYQELLTTHASYKGLGETKQAQVSLLSNALLSEVRADKAARKRKRFINNL